MTVKDDNGNPIESYAYGASRQRLRTSNSSLTTYYAWGGSSVLCEYTETTNQSGTFRFSKSYIYAGSRLLSTQIWNGTTETTEFHHPDRLVTKLVTNNAANTFYEQSTLPFGTSLDAEFAGTPTTNQKFTSYERSQVAQLDYAVNRSYSSGQGRFTSVDPIGMNASSLGNPQSLNLYAYVENNPIDLIDPLGLTYFLLPEEQECRYEPVYTYYRTDVKIIDDDSGNPVSIGGTGGDGSPEGWDVRWVLVCESKRTIAPITTPEPGGGGTTAPPPAQTDPCAGNKGTLDFQTNWVGHIFPRHVAMQNPKWWGKSKYLFYAHE